MAISISAKSKITEAAKPLAEPQTSVQLYMRVSSTTEDNTYINVESRAASNHSEYKLSYNYWKQNTRSCSVNNFDDDNFRNIIAHCEEYLPYIYNDLLNGNKSVIKVLERMLPNLCPYKGYISLEIARKEWLRILKQQKRL